MGRFPELFNETHQDCWTLCEHVTGAKRLHIKVHQVGIVLQFPLRLSDSSHILAALLYSPWRPLQWLCFILVLVQFKKHDAHSVDSESAACTSCVLVYAAISTWNGVVWEVLGECFHPDQIKRGRGDWSSSFSPVAAADYLEFGNNWLLKSVTVCVCVCEAFRSQFNQTSWTRISQLIKQTSIKSQLYLICCEDEGVELCGVSWCFFRRHFLAVLSQSELHLIMFPLPGEVQSFTEPGLRWIISRTGLKPDRPFPSSPLCSAHICERYRSEQFS